VYGESPDGQAPVARAPTVDDSIGMRQLSTPTSSLGSKDLGNPPAIFSPDRRYFVVVTYHGNVENNSNDAVMLLFGSADALRAPKPEVLLTWSSTSNNPAILDVRWLAGRETLLFLGHENDRPLEVYSLNVHTKQLRQITQHPTDIVAFDVTPNLRTIVYLARRPIASLLDQDARTHGVIIDNQWLPDLVSGYTSEKWAVYPCQMFVQREAEEPRGISFPNPEIPEPRGGIHLSPDGRLAVIQSLTFRYGDPYLWREYASTSGEVFLLIDTRTGLVRKLINAPEQCMTCVEWSSDGRSVVVGGTYLPLDIEDSPERALRKTSQWAVEIDAETGAFTKISRGTFRIVRWDANTKTVYLRRTAWDSSGGPRDESTMTFRKSGERWRQIKSDDPLEIVLEQDMNTPPRLVATNRDTGGRSLLLDLNSQFRNLRFGHVEEIAWKGTDGQDATGGLYLPSAYVAGHKYPLVIQVSCWGANSVAVFSIDCGTAGYAAQALAGRGFVVAEPTHLAVAHSTEEAPRTTASIEGMIDYLDARGLIDRDRIGIVGWSFAGYLARYAVAFSRYPFRAAAVVDGSDFGYWQYVSEINVGPRNREIFEQFNGAPPFGQGLQAWMKTAVSFNLDRVHAPIRQLGFGRYWFQYNWESFVGLRRLGKPVEMVWLPEAAHEPVRPFERRTAQQGDVDWFGFWLQGYEDPDPAKAEQYRRWENLCDLQREQNRDGSTFCVPSHTH
jgi:dipeptidyl aminopeptidase/acylaminoacyl peptidase